MVMFVNFGFSLLFLFFKCILPLIYLGKKRIFKLGGKMIAIMLYLYPALMLLCCTYVLGALILSVLHVLKPLPLLVPFF